MIKPKESPTPKYQECDTVYVGDKEWEVDYVHTYAARVEYNLKQQRGYYDKTKFKYNVPEEQIHHKPLSARLARIEAVLNLY